MILEQEEVTVYVVEKLHQELLELLKSKLFEEEDTLAIDLQHVRKVDMSVIQLLVAMRKSCEEYSKKFELLNINPEVLEIFKNSAVQEALGVVS